MRTPIRAIRINDKLWAQTKTKARREGTTASAVIIQLLEAYVRGQIVLTPKRGVTR